MPPADTTSAASSRAHWTTWPVFSAPRGAVAFYLAVEIAVVVIAGLELGAISASKADLLRGLLILGLAVISEEASRFAARMRIKISDALKPDTTSVWATAAAIVLPPMYALGCMSVLMVSVWFRIWRPAGGVLYRKIGGSSTILVGCVAASKAHQLIGEQWRGGLGVAASSLSVIGALVVYTVVQRTLVTIALMLGGVKLSSLRGTWDDNLLEIATLCLGALVAVAVTNEPASAALVLLPMVLLERGVLIRQLEVAATTDSKTGLLNAVAWEQLAQRDLVRSQREGKPMSVLIIDVDRFKWVNDMHGHLVGDMVLRAIGEALTHELRGYDTVGRFGGEEFVASLPNAGDASALMVAERVRIRINQIRISHLIELADSAPDRQLAVCIGVACSPADGSELSELLHQADAALYVAKDSGRNRVELAARAADGPSDAVAVA
jgi:diguanylate cyclase (GGDEF)-like protein